MPKIKYGNIFDQDADLYIVTTSGMLNSRGELVMGKGAALDMKTRFPELPEKFGSFLTYYSAHAGGEAPDPVRKAILPITYGFICYCPQDNGYNEQSHNGKNYGCFQVKTRFTKEANLALIGYSIVVLNGFLSMCKPEYRAVMNFPAIGNGRRLEKDVLPILESLDPRVVLYKLGGSGG